MAIQQNFPEIKPSLNLDFANTKTLDPRITFTRASEGRYYDGKTFAKAEENLLLQSQAFDVSWSTADNVSVSANTTTAPDGTTTADTLAETAVTGIHTSSQVISVSGVVTLSVFAKADSGTPFLTIGLSRSGTDHCSATFDLALGTNTASQAQGAYSGASATITAAAQGFYRCTLTVTTDTATLVRIGLNNTGIPTASNRSFGATYLGSTSNSVYLWGAQLEQRSSVTAYTATTTQPITNYIPALQTAAAGVARFDHNPVTGESLGLLIEEQRTNLLTYSEQFDNAAWTKVRLGNTSDTIIAPDGTLTGDKIFLDSTNSTNHSAGQTVTVTSGTTYTWSVYVKAGELTEVNLRFSAQFPAGNAFFNLSTGVITNIGALSISSITTVGNGWYRCSITQTASSTGSAQPQVFLAQSGSITIATADGYSGVFVWGAQLEAGAFPTSYIKTEAAQATRNADVASMTGANFGSWYRQGRGTMYVEYARNGLSAACSPFDISDGTSTNRLFFVSGFAVPAQHRFDVTTGNVSQANVALANGVVGAFYKAAAAYDFNDIAASQNGSAVATDLSAIIPTVTQARIGSAQGGSVLNGTVRKVAFYAERLTNAQLQALTTP